VVGINEEQSDTS